LLSKNRNHQLSDIIDEIAIRQGQDKLRDQLAALDSAKDIADMDLPGWRLHPLKGKDKGRHAIWVSGNWRMTFEFENGDAYVVDYEDYH